MKAFLRLVLPGLLLWGRLGAGLDPWAQLKTGMTPEAATALLGQPSLRTKGHGMERWLYENGAEVVIRGNVSEWTLPKETHRSAVTRPSAAASKPVPPPVASEPQKAPVPAAPPAPPHKAPSEAETKAELIRLLGFAETTPPPPP